jgi:hypothetical protein
MGGDSGQDSGHLSPGLTWADYLDRLIDERGSLAALALDLSQLAGTPEDSASIERALRRLRQRGTKSGGEYGQRLLRHFGLPKTIEAWARWMGVYHSRFTDLPLGLCLDQLRLWNRPPISESRARIWVQLGFVTCALRRRDQEGAVHALEQAKLIGSAPIAARIEIALVEGFMFSTEVSELDLDDPDLDATDRSCFRARWLDQRAYRAIHGATPDLELAHTLYASIEGALPFVATKREAGLAYVHHRRGDRDRAVMHARAAASEAGDGGLVRLRIAALNLLAHILGDAEGEAIRGRARTLAALLEDEDLLSRTSRPT